MRKKYIGIWSIVLALILVSVPFGVWKAMADTEPAYQIKILEISDNGTFALQTALKTTTNVTVDTMRMKTFVAMRGELNGKYDAIYFGNGAYSPKLPSAFTSGPSNEQRAAHDTAAVMNDITKLKAADVENYYILKGLPVIFNTAIANQTPNGNLFALYNKYASLSNRPSNALFVNDSQLNTVVTNIKNGTALYKQRPRVEITSKPQDFLNSASKIYTTGDTLTFTFNANNVKDFSTPVNAKLYASVDKVLPLSNENVVASSTLTSRAGTLTYKLPQTFSGPVYWKLELTANGQSDYAEGAFRVRDKQTVIRVLQVMPSNDASSLLKAANMTQSYLKTNDYDIQITPVLFSEFNTASTVNSYANLNGRYDMIIFGFVDNYNSQTASSLTDAAAAGVNAFIKTGQAVMFTHDTMIGDKWNPWIKNFQATTGQTGLYTNLGLGAPNPSTRTKVVNTGMLTQFPFDLSLPPSNTNGYVGQIALTHDQYYMLDLEDPTIVPWYNIVSENNDNASYKRDSDDSYDHYYTYSKGNVTYSGTGHTNTNFPEWEQKLFVNTMFRAFIGSNHAPSVTVISPTAAETTKPSYLKELVFSYQVDDLDLNDLNVYSSVKFKVNGQYVDNMAIAEKSVPKGTVITEKFTNPLQLKDGKIQIEITARDKQGATAVKTIDLTIQKVSANLLTERTLDTIPANYEFLTGSTVGMTYKVTPQSIPAADIRSGENGLQTLEISNIAYTEKLPAGLEISGTLPQGMTKTGTASTGYTLSKTFDKITYTLNGSSYEPNKGSTFSFHLDTIPTQKGTYNLNQARLSYEDVHSPSAFASTLQQLKDYSLIVLGSSDLKLAEGTIKGGVAINGNVDTSATVGADLNASNIGFVTSGNLTITKGNIYNGAILAKGNLTAPGFNFNEFSRALIGGDLKFGYASGSAAQTSYGGAYSGPNYLNPQPTQRDATALKNEISQAFNFADSKSKLVQLSNSYANLTSNGTKQPASGTDSGGVITLTGSNPGLNVFNITSADTTDMNDLKIIVPAGASAVVNISGGTLRLSNVVSADPSRTLINYTGTGNLYVGNAPTSLFPKTGGNGSKVDSSVLAPNAIVNYANGNGSLSGSIVANQLVSSGSITLNRAAFAGIEPPSTTAPTPGESRTIQFPDVYFNAIIKTKSITLADQSLWVGDSTVIVPTVTMTDGTTDLTPLLTWSSSKPSVASISYPLGTTGGQSASVSVTGASAGTSTITATLKNSDGTTIVGTALVTVEAPALSIDGSSSVNVGQTIKDLKAVVNATNLRIDNVTWTVISPNTDNVKLAPQADPTSLYVTGSKSGTVKVQATATITNIRTNTVRTLTATKDISIIDSLNSVAVNGPDTVKKGSSIDLSTVILPEAANIGSIVWTVTDGNGNAVLTPGSPAPAKTATLQGVAPGPVTISVTVKTAGDNPIERTVTKTIWVLDFGMNGPDTVYVGDSINFTSSLLPTNYPGAKGTVNWTVSNVNGTGAGIGNYASLGTATTNGNTSTTTLTGSNAGQVKLTATITTPAGDFTVDRIVTIKPIVTALLLPPTVKVEKGVPFDLIAGAPLRVNPISIAVSDIRNQLVWTSADPSGVSVNPNGVVTGLKEGSEVVVTVTYQRTPTSPAITATTKVIVAKAADPNAPTDGDRY
ncbi:DUF5057 domain-containing protein [Saccharibacillus sp. O23]|uniref:DUF5057 domain-containing protein n=1 Tax=Saccharibacillus sp. O23 TaxID=2009338 RepID=UPI0015C637D6|nr:DUF5057 domain-containing protein [Saccharibacillus sp. O23]